MNPGIKSKSFWKIHKLKEIINGFQNNGQVVPFVAIVESWLKPHIHDAQILIENYQVFRSDRLKSKNGGTLLYIHNFIAIEDSVKFDDDTCSCIICFSKTWNCVIISLYRPPNASYDSFSNLLSFINNSLNKFNPSNKLKTFIFGDLNFPGMRWNSESRSSGLSPSSSKLLDFMDEHFLDQYVLKNTRLNNILDLFLTNDPTFSQAVQVEDFQISDHLLVKIYNYYFSGLNTNRKVAIEENSKPDFTKLNFNTSNSTEISRDFANTDWDSLVNGPIEDFPEKFNNKVYEILRRHTSLKKNIKKEFIPKSIYILNRKLRKCRKKLNFLTNNSKRKTKLKEKIMFLQDQKKKKLLAEKLKEEQKAINKIKRDPKYFFGYTKRFRQASASTNIMVGPNNEIVSNPEDIANMMQDKFKSVFSTPLSEQNMDLNFEEIKNTEPLSDCIFEKSDFIQAIDEMRASSSGPKHDVPAIIFKKYKETLWIPLLKFWTKSFRTGIIPKDYKTQIIKILHKKGNKTNPDNWRPISITPHTIKIFERVLRNKMMQYIENNEILNPTQHGFRKNRSCSSQLITHLRNIFEHQINGKEVDCIYLDYSRAFDRVDHNLLLKKLNAINIKDNYLRWIKNFLTGRSQKVLIDNFFSYPTSVQSGVPQGSVLGPILFAIYVNDLPNCVKDCELLTFADDTKIISHIDSINSTVTLQENLDKIANWSKQNNMELNSKKFEMITFRLNSQQPNLKLLQTLPFADKYRVYKLTNGKNLTPSPVVRDLGVTVDSELNWNAHRSIICKKARQRCGWILNVFNTRQKDPLIILFNSLVRPLLEFCCEVWYPYKIKDICEVEQIQRSYTSRISNMQNLNYWERLESLKIESLQRRREKILITIIWKIKNQLYPNSTNIRFKLNPRYQSEQIILPPLPRTNSKLVTKYEESFIIKGAKLWNRLPGKLTNQTSLNQFRTQLNDFMKKIPDRPPISGYVTNTTNSLLDINIPSAL